MNSRIILPFLLVLISASYSLGCSCMMTHPQEIFCSSQYAVKVLVLSRRMVHFVDGKAVKKPEGVSRQWDWSHDVAEEYTVRVYNKYKGDFKKQKVSKIYTDPSTSCHQPLDTGHYYFLTGDLNRHGFMEIESCDYVKDITHVEFLTTFLMNRNFQRNWKRGCKKCSQIAKPGFEDDYVFDTVPNGELPCYMESEDYWKHQGLGASLSYCVPNNKGNCQLWKYDVERINTGGKEKYHLYPDSREIS